MRLSIIIPVYNEEQTIDEVISRVAAVDLAGIQKEIVIANDGSTDGTRRIIDERARLTDADAIGGQVIVLRKGRKDQHLVRVRRAG